MKTEFEIKANFPVPPSVLYASWLSSKGHSEMTGGEAECSDQIGATFSAWDGYISGTNLALKRNEEIVQSWRTSDFKESDADSHLVIRLKAVGDGCEFRLIHSKIPEGQPDYEQGWMEHYIEPMKSHFG
jgi:activator of HSP90 ATPase